MTNEELWQAVLGEVELSISKANFITWFRHTAISSREHSVITVAVPSAFAKEWLESKFNKLIMKSIRGHEPDIRSVAYVISPLLLQQLPASDHVVKKVEEKKQDEQMEFQELSIDKETNLNPRYAFENFIVGSFNELAHAAGRSVVEHLASAYNPLFIYGGVGLGKTHLLQAIGNEVKKNMPHLRVQYTTCERFSNDFIAAIQHNESQKFKDYYRTFDLLIIDDVQFVTGKVRTQEELFHTFNTLYEHNKQIVFSSDRPPKSIPDLEERLRSRFEVGLIADISEPDYETKLAILNIKVKDKRPQPPQETLDCIASSVDKNIRELEGALNLVLAKTHVAGRELSTDEVKHILAQFINKPKRAITAAKIIKEVCMFYDVQEKNLIERSRRREFVKPRQVAMYLLRQHFHGSFPYIGQKFGGRDHTTAIHAFEKITRCITTDEQLAEEVNTIKENLWKDMG